MLTPMRNSTGEFGAPNTGTVSVGACRLAESSGGRARWCTPPAEDIHGILSRCTHCTARSAAAPARDRSTPCRHVRGHFACCFHRDRYISVLCVRVILALRFPAFFRSAYPATRVRAAAVVFHGAPLARPNVLRLHA